MKPEEAFREIYQRLRRLESNIGSGWGNAQQSHVVGLELRTADSFGPGDLGTPPAQIETIVRATGRLLVVTSARITMNPGSGIAAPALSGTNILGAQVEWGIFATAGDYQFTGMHLFEDLEQGPTTVTMMLRGDGTNLAVFSNRKLIVVPI